jgi:predicted double-glycine peptidase
MVVIGIDDADVYLEDPAILGSRLRVPREEFPFPLA